MATKKKIKKKTERETTSFQIKMEPEAHKRLKERANQMNITIGDMIHNLLASFELRIQRLRKRVEENKDIDSIYKDRSLDVTIMEVLFKKDRDDLTDKQLDNEIKKLVDSLTGETWQPKIKFKGGKTITD